MTKLFAIYVNYPLHASATFTADCHEASVLAQHEWRPLILFGQLEVERKTELLVNYI
jgi:hypothetical protein